MPAVNWLAVIVAAVAMFGLGAVWYSPLLFVKPWARAAGLSRDGSPGANFIYVMLGSFVLTLVMAANLAFFLAGPGTTLGFALGASVAAGLGWATLSLWIISLFEQRPFAYVLINGGYLTVGFALMGLILGLWR
ncbi:MAG: DUF1761 domain-containing protein [Devosia sp.]